MKNCKDCARLIGKQDYAGGGDKKCQGNCKDKMPPNPPSPTFKKDKK